MGKTDLIARLAADATKFKSGMKDAEDANKKFAKSSEEAKDSADGLQGRVDKVGAKLMEVAASWAKYATAGAAASAAMKVATDAFKRNETAIDEWGAAVEQGRAAYNTFLDTLNGGDWTNFFSNIGAAIADAKELYGVLDRMGSVEKNNQFAIFETQARLKELRLEKSTATDPTRIAQIDKEAGQLMERLEHLLRQVTDSRYDAAKKTAGKTLTSMYNALPGAALDPAEAARIAEELMRGSQDTFDAWKKTLDQLTAKGTGDVTKFVSMGMWGGYTVSGKGFEINNLSKEEQHLYRLAKAITDGETALQEASQIYLKAAQGAKDMNTQLLEAGEILRMSTKTGGGGGSVSALALGADRTAGTGVGMLGGELLISQMRPTDGAVEHFRKWFEENPPEPIEVPIEVPLDNMKTVADGIAASFNAASGALGNFASQSREATIAAKSFTIAGAIATLVGQFAAIPKGAEIWSWIAGTIAGTGTLVATIASLKNAASYSEGGRIRGRHATGDMVPIMANAGEVVLNASQQRNVAAQLAGGGGGTVTLEIRGDKLVGAINNYGRGAGMGKMVFQP